MDLDTEAPIIEPRGELSIYGQKVSRSHDGHCPYVRWRIAHSCRSAELEEVLKTLALACLSAISAARYRDAEYVTIGNKEQSSARELLQRGSRPESQLCLYRALDRAHHRDRVYGLGPYEVRLRLEHNDPSF